MSIDRIGGSASGAREELLAMIRKSQQAAPTAPARKPQTLAPALTQPVRTMADGGIPARRISIYV